MAAVFRINAVLPVSRSLWSVSKREISEETWETKAALETILD